MKKNNVEWKLEEMEVTVEEKDKSNDAEETSIDE